MKKIIKSERTRLVYIFCLSLISFLIIGFTTGCERKYTAEELDNFQYGRSHCIKTESISETPSPDGQIKAVVYKYDDPCGRYYKENLSIQSNNQKTLSYTEAMDFAISGGDNLRPQWRGNQDLLVMGDDSFSQNDLLVSMKRSFGFGSREDIKVGQSFSYPIGWFGSLTITFEQEKYQVTSEVIKEVVKPVSKDDYYRKAVISRRLCTRQSSGEVIKYLSVELSNMPPTAEPNSNSPKSFSLEYCERRGFQNENEIYKTAFEATIDVKWTTDKELLIIGSEPDGENGLRNKKSGEILIKYQKAE